MKNILSPEADKYLQLLQTNDTDTFTALLLKAGTMLSNRELAGLRWEHIRNTPSGLVVSGKIISRHVEAVIARRAARALAVVRRRRGRVFTSSAWRRRLAQVFEAMPELNNELLWAHTRPEMVARCGPSRRGMNKQQRQRAARAWLRSILHRQAARQEQEEVWRLMVEIMSTTEP
jgi:hypothetical protein